MNFSAQTGIYLVREARSFIIGVFFFLQREAVS